MVSNALMMTMSGKILSERLDVLRLTFYTAPVSCLCLVPFYINKEVRPPLHMALFLWSYLCLYKSVTDTLTAQFLAQGRHSRNN